VKTNAVLLCKSNAMLHFAVLYWRFAVKQKVSRETKKPDAVTRPVRRLKLKARLTLDFHLILSAAF
jgi:hypothetical protein